MEGFTDGVALTVAVAWLKNASGVYTEVPLLEGRAYPAGLLAYTVDSVGVITRWFVPWTSVIYIKQTQPAPVQGSPANPPASTSVTPPAPA